MHNLKARHLELKSYFSEGNTDGVLNTVFQILTSRNGEVADYLAIADTLLHFKQMELACVIARKAFLQDPFSDVVRLWCSEASGISTPPEFQLLDSELKTAFGHFDKICELLDVLGEIVFIDLGSSFGDHFSYPRWTLDKIHTVSLDGLAVPEQGKGSGKRTSIKSIVAGKSHTAIFNEKHFLPASSLLTDDVSVVQSFGMGAFAQIKQRHSVRTITLDDVLKDAGLSRIDALKTDLEGLDFEVIRSVEQLLPEISFLRAELAFLPRYFGEPRFHDCHNYLTERNYFLAGLKTSSWRYKTEHRDFCPDGRLVWGDFEYISDKSVTNAPIAVVARHALVASLCGYPNYAEQLIERQIEPTDTSLSRSLKYVLFAETSLTSPQYVNMAYPYSTF